MPNLSALTLSASTFPLSAPLGSTVAIVLGTTLPPAPTIAGAAGTEIVGQSRSFTPTIVPFVPIISLTLLSGALPPGRVIDAAGLAVTGTLTTAGAFTYVLRATDQNGRRADLAVTETVVARFTGTLDDMSVAGQVNGRTNWAIVGGSNPNNWIVSNGALSYSQLYGDASTRGYLTFGPVVTGDVVAEFDYDRTGDGVHQPGEGGYEPQSQTFYVWFQDANNYLSFQLFGDHALRFYGSVNGSTVLNNLTWGLPNNGLTFGNAGRVKVQIKSGVLRVAHNGTWLACNDKFSMPFDMYDLTGVFPTQNRSGKMGLSAAGWTYPVLRRAATWVLDIKASGYKSAIGRDADLATGGTLAVPVTFTGSPGTWFARLLDFQDGSVVADWAQITGVTAAAGAATVTVVLPSRARPYAVEVGYVDTIDGTLHYTRTTSVLSCRYRILGYGQSNMTQRRHVPDTYPAVVGCSTKYPSTNPGDGGGEPLATWCHATSASSYLPISLLEACKALAAATGQAVMAQVCGAAGTGLTFLAPGAPGNGAAVYLTPGLAEGQGFVDAMIWDQGEGDADGTYGPAEPIQYPAGRSGYAATFLQDLLAPIRALVGNPNMLALISPVGNWADTSTVANNRPTGDAALIDLHRDQLYQQYLAICAGDDKCFIASSKLGTAHADAYHYTPEGYVEICRRDGYSLARRLIEWERAHAAAQGLPVPSLPDVPDGRGPIVTGAALSGGRTALTLTLNMNGAAALTGLLTFASGPVSTLALPNSLDGYQVSANDFTSLLAISSVASSGNTIVLTLAGAAPAGTVKVRSFYGWSYDDTKLICGTGYADARAALPVFPIRTPLIAA